MDCPACGTHNPAAAKFCEECGVRLPRRCPACGHDVGARAKFCLECGRPVGTNAPPPATAREAPAPETYTPRHLAERILSARADLEGERKHVTVLFADIKGSTELIEGLDPEEAQALLAPAVRAMLSAVHRYEGTVCRVMGDGIMALFGAPLAHEDHAARACYAALTMQDAIRRYGDDVREREGVLVLARVGLNSGEVVVGSISNDLHVEYSAIGPTTHLAARMEQLAVPGTIQVTAETLRLAEGLVEVRSLGKIPVRGLGDPVAAFELVGAGAGRRRLQATAARGLTPFVGRQAESEALERALDLTRDGGGRIVATVGEPGIGKSRLFYEFTHAPRTEGWTILEAGSVSYGKATSYLPVIDLLKGYCRIEARDDVRTAREKLLGRVLTLDRTLEADLPPLLALLDLPVEDHAWAALDPPRRRQATLDAVRRLLIRESQEQPLVLVFEDLHWIDAETQALLDGLVDSLPTARILLLVNYRPEYSHAWGNKSYYTQLRIHPLGQGVAGDLLRTLLGDDPAVQPLRSLLFERTAGNPFFLEESVQALVEDGTLVGERGAYRLARSATGVRVPATVQAILAARIDRLAPADKRLLQTAAVIGKDVPSTLLRDITEGPTDDFEAGLTRLQAAELLYGVSLYPEPEYTFKHALTHEVAYGSLLHERRRALHARIVEAIERRYPDRLDEHVERLAHHALRGDGREQAVGYALRAGRRAIERSASAEAIGYLTAGLDLLKTLPSNSDHIRRELELLTALGPVLMPTKGYGSPDVEALYARALELCRQVGETAQPFPVVRGLWEFYEVRGDLQTARELSEELLRLASSTDDSGLTVVAHNAVGETLTMVGELARAREHLDRGIALYDSARHRGLALAYGGYDPGVMCRVWSAFGLWCLGYPDQSQKRSDEALALARDLGHLNSLPFALSVTAILRQYRREPQAAQEAAEAVIALSADQGFSFWGAFATMLRGWALGAAGAHREGIDLVRDGLSAWEATGARVERPLWLGLLAETCARAGQIEAAMAAVAEAHADAEQTGSLFHRAELHRLEGELLLGQSTPDDRRAEACFRTAVDVARRQQARTFELRASTSLARLWQARGRRSEAQEILRPIYGWFREGFETADLADARALLMQTTGDE